jgi:hypothetical protein
VSLGGRALTLLKENRCKNSAEIRLKVKFAAKQEKHADSE